MVNSPLRILSDRKDSPHYKKRCVIMLYVVALQNTNKSHYNHLFRTFIVQFVLIM
ncbi:hypothetical protein M153_3700005913 [Pseudoloma neurophilia]|uniref:Uncharacterized protein n=1 Tax=Pseudoloma neurophilia TaxID=146866 RepID=A0A0R0LXU4_9MICR|nr:hypothetical protein M153_3700005913 [Pseudoloma neurophilia]